MTGRIINNEPQGARLPILGKIKIGKKELSKKTGKEYPVSTDYFIASGKYEELFRQAYGAEPRQIQIVFISDNISDVCNEHYEIRDQGGRLLAEGDGQNWKAYDKQKDAYTYGIYATTEELEKRYGFEARAVLTLRFILPAIPGVFGVWQFTTKGVHSSIPQIRDTFDQVQLSAGTIINIPFDLIVEKVQSQKPGSASVFPVVSLIPNLSQSNLDLLSEFVASGQRIRGMLTEERIRQIAENSHFTALPEHYQEAEIEEVQPEPQQESEQESEPEIELMTIDQKKELWKLAKAAIFNEETFAAYMLSKGFNGFQSANIPVEWYEVMKGEIKSGRAMELANIVKYDAKPEVPNVQD